MQKISLIAVLFAAGFFMAGCAFTQTPAPTPTRVGLTHAEAKIIAEKNCIKGGEALSDGNYNENSKTWWFDANLNATREGCNPACVVSEETKTAEINWRCTGLVVPTEPTPGACGIENCHGLDITCGPNVAEICTEIYMAGDNCRQFASCQTTDGQCKLVKSDKFENCKACVEKCQVDFGDDQMGFFQCESKCSS